MVLNINDMTTPSLRVGHETPEIVGIPLLNNLATELTNIVVQVEANEQFAQTERRFPGIPGGSVSQVAFDLCLRNPSSNRKHPEHPDTGVSG